MIRPALVVSLLLATPLVAQETADTVEEREDIAEEVQAPLPVMIRASDIEEAVVYSLADSYDQDFWDRGEPFGAVAADWGEVGEVEDLVINDAGGVVGVTVEVGGFLGIGEKTVLVPLADLRLVQRPEAEGFFIVTRMSNEQFEASDDIEDEFVEVDD